MKLEVAEVDVDIRVYRGVANELETHVIPVYFIH